MSDPSFDADSRAEFARWLRFWRWVVAIVEMAGGLLGLYVVAFAPLIGSSRVVLLLAFTFFVTAFWGGFLLARNRPQGVQLSAVVQGLQVIQISAGHVLYSLVCGVQLLVGIHPLLNLSVSALTSKFFLMITPAPPPTMAEATTGVNVAAVLALVCLFYVWDAHRVEALKAKPSTSVPEQTEEAWPPSPRS